MSLLKNKIQNILISQRLIIFSIILIIFISILFILSVQNIRKTKQQTENIKNYYYHNSILLSNINNKIDHLTINNHILIEKNTGIIKLQTSNKKRLDEINEMLSNYKKNIITIEQSILFENFQLKFQEYQNIIQEIFNYRKNNQDQISITPVLINKEIEAYYSMQEILNEIKKQNNYELNINYNQIRHYNNKIIIIISIFTAVLIIILIIYFFLFTADIKKYYSQFTKNLQKLSRGEIPDDTIIETKSEIGRLAVLLNILTTNMQQIENFASLIEKEKYDLEYKLLGEKDKIGLSLINMRENIISVQEKNKARQIEEEKKNWATAGSSKFSEIMRHSSDNIQKLSDEIIKNIVLYIDAKLGGLFIYNNENPDDIHLFLLSTFAYDRKKHFTRKIKLGDGLVGTAALDKTTIYITDIPEDYIEIESGLGDATPRSLLIVPLKTERGLLGVIEIASFKKIEEHERLFVENLAETVASTLETVKINARTIELLKESEKKSEDLQKGERELRETMEQVQLAQEESERRAAEMSSILLAVDQALLKIEIDTQGNIISANQRLIRTFGYLQDEIVGQPLHFILPQEHKNKDEQILQELKEGKTHRDTYKFTTSDGKTIWLLSQFAPIFGAHNNLIRILYLSLDISEQKEIEEKNIKLLDESNSKADELMKAHAIVKQNEMEMQGIITAIDQTLMKAEYSFEGNLLSANENHITTMGYDFAKTKGKNILSFIPDDEFDEFKALWKKVQHGENRQTTVKRKSQATSKDIWLLNQYTPIKDAQNKVQKILYMAIDITEQKEIEQRIKENEIEMQGIITAVDQTLMKAEYSYEGKLISANERHISTMGYDFEATKGKNIQSFIPKDEIDEFNAIWTKVQQGEPEQITVKRKSQATGKDIWLLNQYTPIKDAQNKVHKILYMAIDVTEQKEIEQQIKENEIEMQGIITAVDQTLMKAEYSYEGNLLSANNKHISTMGYDFEATKGKNIISFIPDDEIDEFKTIWKKVQQGESEQITVKRKSQATGEDIWLLNQYTPIKDAQNRVQKILYMAIDITEQKNIEQQNKKLLQQAENRQNILVKSHQEMRNKEIETKGIISAIDQTLMKAEYSYEGILLSANEKHIQTMGYDYKKTKNKNIISFIPEDEIDEFKKIWNKIQKGESYQMPVKRINKATGKNIWLLNQYTPIVDDKKNIYKILYFAIDITQQKNIEQKNIQLLRKTKEREKTLLQTQEIMKMNQRELNAIISAVNQTLMKAEYSVNGVLLSANQNHISIMGYDFEITKGSNILIFIPEDELKEFQKTWERVQKGEPQQITVKRQNQTTNETLWLLNQYTPIKNQNGKVYKILYIAVDITKQKQIEAELLQQEEEMKLNMEELINNQMEMEQKIDEYQKINKQHTDKFDSDIDKKYDQWLSDF